jgi:hypothetical protein
VIKIIRDISIHLYAINLQLLRSAPSPIIPVAGRKWGTDPALS